MTRNSPALEVLKATGWTPVADVPSAGALLYVSVVSAHERFSW